MNVEKLWLIWRSSDPEHRRRYHVGTLQRSMGGKYSFQYEHGEVEEAKKHGFGFFPGFEKDKKYTKEGELFSNIMVRLPKAERDDYLDILNRYGLSDFNDSFEVLRATRGRLVTDNFEFVPAFDENRIEFEVAGVEHRKTSELEKAVESGDLTNGAKLLLERELENEYDSNAIKILLPTGQGRIFVGYVPRYYSKYLAEKIDANVRYSAVVTRVDLGSKNRDEKISTAVRLMFE